MREAPLYAHSVPQGLTRLALGPPSLVHPSVQQGHTSLPLGLPYVGSVQQAAMSLRLAPLDATCVILDHTRLNLGRPSPALYAKSTATPPTLRAQTQANAFATQGSPGWGISVFVALGGIIPTESAAPVQRATTVWQHWPPPSHVLLEPTTR